MNLQYEKLVSRAIRNISSPRTRDIINARFGLVDGERQTLEAIGQRYGITRERVRQIVDAVFTDLKKDNAVDVLKPAFQTIDNYFNQKGNVVREERLLTDLTNINESHPERGAVFFILTLQKMYQRYVESGQFYPLWSNSKDALNKAGLLISGVIADLNKQNQPVSFEHIEKCVKMKVSNDVLESYLDAAKQIAQNTSKQFGLSKWPEINPRGVKDKAYIIFKEQNNPLHFREVASLINEAKMDSNIAQAQTVHNELIKDDRFILVGRGTYALKEWGYQAGTVREVIVNVLKGANSLTKEQVVDKVLKSRLVKKNTVLINLQNKNYFVRQGSKYTLK